MAATKLDGRGVTAAVGAYAAWGLFPAFWPLLAPAVPLEVLAHRIAWTAVLMVGVLTLVRGWPELRALNARGWGMVTAAGLLISVNWGLYIYAVFQGQIVEAALGYFMSPLVSVLLGVLVLRERMSRAQWVAVALGTTAVVVIAVENGRPPWIALTLAVSFGTYGLIKRTVPLSATASVTAEGLVLGPFAIAVVVWFQVVGGGTMIDHGSGHLLLLIAAGPVTAVPLLLYGAAAARPAEHDRRADVPEPHPAVLVGRVRRARGHAGHPMDRLRPDLDRTGDLHVRPAPHPPCRACPAAGGPHPHLIEPASRHVPVRELRTLRGPQVRAPRS